MNRGLYRELIEDEVIKTKAAKIGLERQKPNNNTQFFLYATLTDTNFAGFNWELASCLGKPRFATVTNQTLFELIQLTVKNTQ